MELIPLGPGFAAEVRGTGLRDVAASDEIYNAVRAAFEEHSVLLFRDQQVTASSARWRRPRPRHAAKVRHSASSPTSSPTARWYRPDTRRNCARVPTSCGTPTAASRFRRH
jgi:alpha-ketoglutarate-dependent taurine dioxygenase